MCLYKVKKLKPCTTGYKVMVKTARGYVGEYRRMLQSPHKLGEWSYEEKHRMVSTYNSTICMEDGGEYPYGFHVFHHLTAARRWRSYYDDIAISVVIVKVAVDEPVATGLQSCNQIAVPPDDKDWCVSRVTVAKKIKVLGEVK